MKRTPIFALVVLLMVLVLAFSGCELSFDLKDKESDTTNAGDTASGTSVFDIIGVTATPIETDPNGVPMVTVEVTNKKGEVVATEKVTLTADEIQSSKDFFKPAEPQTTLPTGVLPERVTEEDVETNEQTKPQVSTKPILSDVDIVYSDKYTVTGRIEYNGNVELYKVARDGNKYAAIANYDGSEIGIIAGEENIYFISVAEKTYITIPKSLIEEETQNDESYKGLLTGEAFNINKTVVEETTEEDHGIKYKVIKYEDGSMDYVKGRNLIKSVSPEGAVLYYDTVSSEVSAGVFLPPVGYTETPLDSENIADMVETITTTEHVHNHDE